MPARLSLAIAAAALLAATPLAATPLAAKDKPAPLACAGVYGPDSSEALVIETFGAENVVTGMVYGPEGSELLATTVFGDDDNRAIEFFWFDEDNRTHLSDVRLAPGQVGPGGVRIGMSVAQVAALNGEPFSVGGFWWDYGGYANMESGALAGQREGGCYLSIRFAPADDYPEDLDVTAVSGEVQVSSDDPLLETLDTRVQVLSLGYPWPDDLPQPQY